MGFRKLLEMTDKIAREELGDYYIISESRMNNYLQCLEDGAKQIQQLTSDYNDAHNKLLLANAEIIRLKEVLQRIASVECVSEDDAVEFRAIAQEALEI